MRIGIRQLATSDCPNELSISTSSSNGGRSKVASDQNFPICVSKQRSCPNELRNKAGAITVHQIVHSMSLCSASLGRVWNRIMGELRRKLSLRLPRRFLEPLRTEMSVGLSVYVDSWFCRNR